MTQRVEEEILKSLSGRSSFARIHTEDDYQFNIRTAHVFDFDEENTNLIQEFLPNTVNLKQYALEHYSGPTPDSLKPQCHQLGEAVGAWLKGYEQWASRQDDLRKVAAENEFAQDVKHMLYFGWLRERVKQYPVLLDDVQDIFEQTEQMAAAERQEVDKLHIIHGDLAPGKYVKPPRNRATARGRKSAEKLTLLTSVILPNTSIEKNVDIPMFIIDWECAQLGVLSADFGEMVGELYALWLYKSITAGLWIMEGFVAAYGDFDEDPAFRAAIQIGAHLLCITPESKGWGTPQQVEDVVRVGRDIIVHAWKRDRGWFEKGDLACLFKASS